MFKIYSKVYIFFWVIMFSIVHCAAQEYVPEECVQVMIDAIPVSVNNTTSVSALKHILAFRLGIPVELQCLYLVLSPTSMYELPNDFKIKDCYTISNFEQRNKLDFLLFRR